MVYPSHDYSGNTSATIAEEKIENPRLQFSREDFIAAMEAHHPVAPELFEESIRENSK